MFAQKPSNGGKFQTKAITTVRAGLGVKGIAMLNIFKFDYSKSI